MISIETIENLKREQREWIFDRIQERASGRLFFPSHVIKKYRTFSGDNVSSSEDIRMGLINYYQLCFNYLYR